MAIGWLSAAIDAAGVERTALSAFFHGSAAAIVFAARHPQRADRLLFFGAQSLGHAHSSPPPPRGVHACTR